MQINKAKTCKDFQEIGMEIYMRGTESIVDTIKREEMIVSKSDLLSDFELQSVTTQSGLSSILNSISVYSMPVQFAIKLQIVAELNPLVSSEVKDVLRRFVF